MLNAEYPAISVVTILVSDIVPLRSRATWQGWSPRSMPLYDHLLQRKAFATSFLLLDLQQVHPLEDSLQMELASAG